MKVFVGAAYFVAGTDIGKFTMKAVDDVRTLNKSLHFRPSCNCLSMNELASLWEKKIGRTLPRITVTEADLLAAAGGGVTIIQFTVLKFCRAVVTCYWTDSLRISNFYAQRTSSQRV